MPSEPLVTIILVNWNGRDVTLDCLASLHDIAFPNRTILVVDNASTDGSSDAFRSAFPGVEVLALKENRRFAGGMNAGIRHALAGGAELLLLMNNDTVVDRDFLGPMVDRLRSDSATGMVVPKIYYHDPPDLIWFAGSVISFWTGTMRHTGIREVDTGQHDTPAPTAYATGCCILTSRELVERIGILDETYYMYSEDADWSMRARRAGYRIMYEPRAKIWHKLSVSAGGHLSWYKMKNKFIGNFRFFARYASWYQWPVFPWLSVIVNGVSALRYLPQRGADVELGKHLSKGIWGLADKTLPVIYGLGYVVLVIRVLPEEEFGNFVILQEIFLIISGLATAFALQPLLKYAAEEGADMAGVVSIAFWFNLAFVAVSSALVVALSVPAGIALHSPALPPLLAYVPAMLAASFIRNFTLVLLQARFQIRNVFWVDAAHFIGAPFLVWVYSRMHLFDSAMDLIVINVISLGASSLVGLVLARPLLRWKLHPKAGDRQKMWEYGTYSLGGIASYLVYSKADTFILAAFMGPFQVAVYNSVKVFTRVFDMITQVVQMFVLPAVSLLSSQGDHPRLKALVEKAVLFSTVVMIPFLLLFLLGPGLLVRVLYSGRYAGAIPILQIFALLSLVVPLLAVGSNTLMGLGHARVNFILGLQMLAVSITLYLVFIPPFAGIGAAIGLVLASFIMAWMTTARLNREVPLSLRGVLKRKNDIGHFLKSRLG